MNDLILVCETCRRPISDDRGSLYVRTGDIVAYREAKRLWDEAHPSGRAISAPEILLHPRRIHWRTGHDACRTDHDEGCYEIDEPQVRSWLQLAKWMAHLMAKTWFASSDWDALLRELSGEAPARRIRVAAREAA